MDQLFVGLAGIVVGATVTMASVLYQLRAEARRSSMRTIADLALADNRGEREIALALLEKGGDSLIAPWFSTFTTTPDCMIPSTRENSQKRRSYSYGKRTST